MPFAVRLRVRSRATSVARDLVVAALLLACLPACQRTEIASYSFNGETMGTVYMVTVAAPFADDLEITGELGEVVAATLAEVDQKMSTYKPDSELSRFNASEALTPFKVSPETLDVFVFARTISEDTEGAFDVTVGPIVNAYGFGPEKKLAPHVSDDELAELRERVGYNLVTINEQDSTIQKLRPDVYVDLSAIAKGYAVDQVAHELDAAGYTNYMIEVGGEVRTGGFNAGGAPWRIAIEQPMEERGKIQKVAPMSGVSMATSGDYRNYVEVDGERVSHTIDPRTGRPIAHNLASVSVITEECALADGLATALMVLGPEEGRQWAESHGLACYFLVRQGDGFESRETTAFTEFIERGTGRLETAS